MADLEDFFAMSRRPLPLLVRVLHRSRLRYYGKPGQNIEFPFQVRTNRGFDKHVHVRLIFALGDPSSCLRVSQAYLEVADQSGVMSMVLWNDLCPEWYQRLTVGSVLYLQNYALKRSYAKRSRPQLGPLALDSFSSIGQPCTRV